MHFVTLVETLDLPHVVDSAEAQTTYCGRTRPDGGWPFLFRSQPDPDDICHRCLLTQQFPDDNAAFGSKAINDA